MYKIAFIDTEVDSAGRKVHDIGGVRTDGATFHGCNVSEFVGFLRGVDYVCGHNIIRHDLKYVGTWLTNAGIKIEYS